MTVRNLTNRYGRAIENQFVMWQDRMRSFQSYNSLIFSYDYTTKVATLYPDWDYSQTTSKHFKSFINSETPFSYDNKAQFTKDYIDSGLFVLENDPSNIREW